MPPDRSLYCRKLYCREAYISIQDTNKVCHPSVINVADNIYAEAGPPPRAADGDRRFPYRHVWTADITFTCLF